MLQRRRFTLAILVSVVAHGVLLGWLKLPEQPAEPVVLELVLAVPEPEPAIPDTDPVPLPPPELTPEVAVVEPEPALLPAEPVEPDERTADPQPRTVLNLTPPDDWQPLLEEAGAPDIEIPFNPDLEEAVAVRETDKRRKALVESRVAAVYGVPDDAYTLVTGVGTEIKIKGRCYVLKDDVIDGITWWPAKCTDTRHNPFSLPPIEYDAIGRMIAD